MLNADLTVHRGKFSTSVSLSTDAGSTIAVVGPNGAGKTTLLRALAGLTPLDGGFIQVDGVDWERVDAGVRLAPDSRNCALVLADPLLFPHRSVEENIAFGQRARGVSRRSAHSESLRWLGRLGMADFADRHPGSLSTGQQQRVSLARAMAVAPAVLLLDEPLAAQDPLVRSELRIELQDMLASHPGITLIVTHDPVDALTLADEVVVLESGLVAQSGSPAQLAARPRTEFVAQMVGLNLLRGTAHGHRVELAGGGSLQPADKRSGLVLVAFSPHAVALSLPPSAESHDRAASSPRNVWDTQVADLQHLHGRVRVRLLGPPDIVAEVTPAAAAELGIRAGQHVIASVKATEIEVYPG